MKQSTLSRRLRNLECKLGSTLFERTNGGTRPTIHHSNGFRSPSSAARS
ncbi:LysR family transcriptional regulator [Bradyrhizobium sp. CSA207]|nr:LysR family transcriptional regulator [Bradyrhizobium sp. CSA207]